jgi:hypothetical protein
VLQTPVGRLRLRVTIRKNANGHNDLFSIRIWMGSLDTYPGVLIHSLLAEGNVRASH